MPSILDYKEFEMSITDYNQDMDYMLNFEVETEIDDCLYCGHLDKCFTSRFDHDFEYNVCSIPNHIKYTNNYEDETELDSLHLGILSKLYTKYNIDLLGPNCL